MMMMLRSFLVIVWFGALLLDDVLAMQTNETPSSVKSTQLSRVKGLIGLSSATVGLIVGKKILNGPTFDEIVSLNGKNVAITGANTGLGKETAMKLASFNANLYLLCKDQNKGIEAASDIMKQTGNRNVNVLQVDLSSLRSIETCATQLHSYVDRIDVLINNAGVMAIPTRQVTKDGFESHLGINHLGHYALTGLLMDLLSNTNKASSLSSPSSSIDNNQCYSRIVNVASLAHTIGKIDMNDLMLSKPGVYDPWLAYGNSKQANILFTREMARRLASSSSTSTKTNTVIPLTCHPGVCRTELGRYLLDPSVVKNIPPYLMPLLGVVGSPIVYFTKSANEGAQTQIYLSATKNIGLSDAGKYFDNSAPSEVSANARDDALALQLWQESERLTGIKYNLL